MEKVDLKDYEHQINDLVDYAIDTVTDNVLTHLGIGDGCGPVIEEYNKVYEQIQDYLIEKWKKEKHDRLLKQKLDKVIARVEDQITNPKWKAQDNGKMCFTTVEEASKAATILVEKGYNTELDYDEGYEQVKYWKPGHEPEPDCL